MSPRLPRIAAATASALAAGLTVIALAAPAHAEDATPIPTDTTQPSASADVSPTPEPPATDPSPPTTTPPTTTPPAPTDLPPAKPTASRLPLREGAVGWRVTDVQKRLAWLGYTIYPANIDNERMGESTVAAVKKFQSKFGFRPTGVVGPGTYDLLTTISGKVGRLPSACTAERSICIDKTQRLVRLVDKGKVLLALDARFGMSELPTREGTFRVTSKSRDHVSSLYRTWMPFALFFSGGQAVHYSPYFARDGYAGASHGCVNLRDMGRAEWLFDHVTVGTRVHVYRS